METRFENIEYQNDLAIAMYLNPQFKADFSEVIKPRYFGRSN